MVKVKLLLLKDFKAVVSNINPLSEPFTLSKCQLCSQTDEGLMPEMSASQSITMVIVFDPYRLG